MCRKVISFLMILFSAMYVHAESTSFEEANALYADKKYEEAAEKYEEILSNSGISAELYYNLGNAYFRMNELGKSILNYERALRLSPNFKDAKFNLEFANQKVIDQIELSDTFFLKKWTELLMKTQTANTWFYISAGSFIVVLIVSFIFLFGSTKALRKSFFYVGLIFLLVSITSITFSSIRKKMMISHQEGIVMTGSVVIKGSPDKSGTDLFQLHEGTKVFVLSSLNDWYEIRLASGSVGWVEIKYIEKI